MPNAGPSLGRQAIHATVPGAYYADQGYLLWDEGRYGWSIASHAASFVEAGLGVATLGWSTRYLAAQRAASTAIQSVARGATVVPRSTGAVESAFSVASRGGRHAGFLQRASGMSRGELERTARSLQQGIQRHEGYLRNPSSHVPDWSQLRPQHQQSLINHWHTEIRTFSEQQSSVHHLLL